MRELLEHPELNRRFGMEARRTVEARFADEVVGSLFLDVWRKMLQRVGRGA
jgi:hypothetical protein